MSEERSFDVRYTRSRRESFSLPTDFTTNAASIPITEDLTSPNLKSSSIVLLKVRLCQHFTQRITTNHSDLLKVME